MVSGDFVGSNPNGRPPESTDICLKSLGRAHPRRITGGSQPGSEHPWPAQLVGWAFAETSSGVRDFTGEAIHEH